MDWADLLSLAADEPLFIDNAEVHTGDAGPVYSCWIDGQRFDVPLAHLVKEYWQHYAEGLHGLQWCRSSSTTWRRSICGSKTDPATTSHSCLPSMTNDKNRRPRTQRVAWLAGLRGYPAVLRGARGEFQAGSMANSSIPPAWTDHNVHDPGVTLLQVLAYTLGALALVAASGAVIGRRRRRSMTAG